MKRKLTGKTRTVAVLGSIAALGGGVSAVGASASTHGRAHASGASQTGGPPALAALTTGERTALEAVQKAIQADTKSVATPILDQAVSDGTITSAQESTLLSLIEQGPMGHGPGGHGMPPGGGPPPASS